MTSLAFPADETMPGIATAVDPVAMRGLFQAKLHAVSGTAYRIDDCRLMRLRRRAAVHCVVQYELSMTDTRTGRRGEAWLSGAIYPDDRARNKWKRLRAAHAGDMELGWCRAFGPAFHLPAPNMLVQSFPCDRRVTTLSKIVGGMPRELETMLLREFGAGDWRVARCDMQSVGYRALLGAVLRCTIEARDASNGGSATRTFYVKVYGDAAGAKTCRVLNEIRNGAKATDQPYSVARPVGYLGELRALVMDRAPGISLEQAILKGSDAEKAARQTARALAAFHRNAVVATRCRTTEDVIARARVAANYVRWACPHLSVEIDSILKVVEPGLKRAAPGPAHLDIKPDHVFLDGERVVFLDLDSYGQADPLLDVAALLARLDAMPSLSGVPASRTRAVARAFSDEYFAHVPDNWQHRLPVNHACVALRLACEIFRSQHPDWRELVPAWVGRARRESRGH